MPVKIFFCYAHEDEELLIKLKTHLRPLQRQGLIDVWYDRNISAGSEWEKEIDKHLNTAQIILLLVSPDFMNSDYCYGKEMQRALERDKRGEARVIPVILRQVYWKDALGHLQVLPVDTFPVISRKWHNLDEAFFDVVKGIREVIEPDNYNDIPPFSEPKTPSIQWIEASFASEDWDDVSRKIPLLMKKDPERVSAKLYYMQGWSLYKTGQIELAYHALDDALSYTEDRALRLIILDKYTTILISQKNWKDVLKFVREALHLDPNNPYWLGIEREAKLALAETPEQRLTLLHDFADNLSQLGSWREVLDYTNEALQLSPNNLDWLKIQWDAKLALAGASSALVIRDYMEIITQRLSEKMDFLDLGFVKHDIQRIRRKFQEMYLLTVVIVGKQITPIINALLRERILPQLLNSKGNIIIKWGETPKALLYFHLANNDSTNVKEFTGKHIVNEIDQFLFEDQYIYERLEIFWPLDLCHEGVVIIVKPSLTEEWMSISYSRNVTLFTMYAPVIEGLDWFSLDSIKTVADVGLFLIVDGFNNLILEDQELVREQVLSHFNKVEAKRVFFIDTQDALEGYLGHNREKLEQSGIQQFEEAFTCFLWTELWLKIIRPELDNFTILIQIA
jgi:tetratricopeptide (TPR) repeat protein